MCSVLKVKLKYDNFDNPESMLKMDEAAKEAQSHGNLWKVNQSHTRPKKLGWFGWKLLLYVLLSLKEDCPDAKVSSSEENPLKN